MLLWNARNYNKIALQYFYAQKREIILYICVVKALMSHISLFFVFACLFLKHISLLSQNRFFSSASSKKSADMLFYQTPPAHTCATWKNTTVTFYLTVFYFLTEFLFKPVLPMYYIHHQFIVGSTKKDSHTFKFIPTAHLEWAFNLIKAYFWTVGGSWAGEDS